VWVDISETIDLKLAALREHKSQIGDWDEMDGWVRERAADMGKTQNLEYAEGFKYFKLRD
jgi:LmbE family N-acetylglucosaminyl deacetylase